VGARRRRRGRRHDLSFDATAELFRLTGVDLTAITGFQAHTVLKILSETGLDMSKWPTVKHFGAWLGLAPNNRVSGGKVLRRRTTPSANRAAAALRVAAQSLHRSKSALGAFLRRKAAQRGMPKAITATAYKLAVILYTMLTQGTAFVELGQDYYERAHQARVLKSLERRARQLGYSLVQNQHMAAVGVAG
jgi:transposase